MARKRGNPNQEKLISNLSALGYIVKIKHNQICIENEEPMTLTTATEFFEKIIRQKEKIVLDAINKSQPIIIQGSTHTQLVEKTNINKYFIESILLQRMEEKGLIKRRKVNFGSVRFNIFEDSNKLLTVDHSQFKEGECSVKKDGPELIVHGSVGAVDNLMNNLLQAKMSGNVKDMTDPKRIEELLKKGVPLDRLLKKADIDIMGGYERKINELEQKLEIAECYLIHYEQTIHSGPEGITRRICAIFFNNEQEIYTPTTIYVTLKKMDYFDEFENLLKDQVRQAINRLKAKNIIKEIKGKKPHKYILHNKEIANEFLKR